MIAKIRFALVALFTSALAAAARAQIAPGPQTGDVYVSGLIDQSELHFPPYGFISESYSIVDSSANNRTVGDSLSELGFSARSGSTENAVFTSSNLDFSGNMFAQTSGSIDATGSRASAAYEVAFTISTATTFNYLFTMSSNSGQTLGGLSSELTGLGYDVTESNTFELPTSHVGQITLDPGTYDFSFLGQVSAESDGFGGPIMTSFDIRLTAVPDRSSTWSLLFIGVMSLVAWRSIQERQHPSTPPL